VCDLETSRMGAPYIYIYIYIYDISHLRVKYMQFGHTYIPTFSLYQVLEIPLLASQCQQTLSAQFM